MSDNKLLYYIIAFISLLALVSFILSPFPYPVHRDIRLKYLD